MSSKPLLHQKCEGRVFSGQARTTRVAGQKLDLVQLGVAGESTARSALTAPYITVYVQLSSLNQGQERCDPSVLLGLSLPQLLLSYALTHLRAHLALLERVFDSIILSDHNLPLLLSRLVLDPHLLCVFGVEVADESWIPQLTRNTQVLTAAHQGIGLAPLSSGGNTVRLKVLLLAARYRDKSIVGVSIAIQQSRTEA